MARVNLSQLGRQYERSKRRDAPDELHHAGAIAELLMLKLTGGAYRPKLLMVEKSQPKKVPLVTGAETPTAAVTPGKEVT